MCPWADTRPATPIGNFGLADKPTESGAAVNHLVVAHNVCVDKQSKRLQGFVEKGGSGGLGGLQRFMSQEKTGRIPVWPSNQQPCLISESALSPNCSCKNSLSPPLALAPHSFLMYCKKIMENAAQGRGVSGSHPNGHCNAASNQKMPYQDFVLTGEM